MNPIYLKQVYPSLSNQVKSEIFTTFEKIHRLLISNFKSEETKNQIKAHLLYLAYSHFYNYKPSPRILRQHCVLLNLENKDIVITKPDKGNGVVILDQKPYDNAIQEIISDISKFEKLNEHPRLKRKTSLQRFLRKLKQKNVFNKNVYDKLYPSGSAPALSSLHLLTNLEHIEADSLRYVN